MKVGVIDDSDTRIIYSSKARLFMDYYLKLGRFGEVVHFEQVKISLYKSIYKYKNGITKCKTHLAIPFLSL